MYPVLALLLATAQFSAMAQTPPGAEVDPVDEVEQLRKDFEATYQGINAMNPMTDQFAPSGVMMTPPFGDVLKNPALGGLMKTFSDPSIQRGVLQLSGHPSRLNLIYAEAVFFFAMLVFRAWRMSKREHWFGKLWVKTYCFVIGSVMGTLVIPALIFGQPYLDLAKALISAFGRS